MWVLPAGPPPPNPSELIGSARMRLLLEHLTNQADIVIVDTNPVLTVSDSLPLFDSVSGIVVVARINQTSKDAVSRLRRVIETAHGTVLGVVATGTQTSGLYGRYGYGYGAGDAYPTSNGNGTKPPRGLLRRFRRVSEASSPSAEPPEGKPSVHVD